MPKNKLSLSPANELKILRKIVDITTSDIDFDGVLAEVVRTVTEIGKADSVFVYLFDDMHKNLVLRASKTSHKKEVGLVTLKVGEGLTGWVAKNVKPLAIKDNAYSDPRFKAFDVLPEDKYEAFLALPIIYKGKAIGVINLQHKNPHEYPQAVVDLLSMIARQVGGVIEHARLYDATREKALQFDALVKVSHSITSEKYLDEILNLIVLVTAEMLNSKICSVMLLDPKGVELSIKATQSLSDDYKKKPNVKVDSSLIGEAVKFKRPVVVEDVRKEKRYAYRDLAAKEGLTSMLAIPMIVKDKAVGVINIYTREPHIFSEGEVDILQMVANQAAVAVENTRWMEEALKAKEALETRKIVERAKGVLMRMHNLSEDAAYRMINKKSMDTCKSMKDIAESILLMADLEKGIHLKVSS
ncbi:MAG: GAF domain-containing protein [Candidatus Omnitrophica bacterium]|nr:GAF domain-containing protein [Candidatus Omnitrophota bacterium]